MREDRESVVSGGGGTGEGTRRGEMTEGVAKRYGRGAGGNG